MKSAWIAILALSLPAVSLAAGSPAQPEKMELQGKQFVRVDGKWYVESKRKQLFEVVPDVVTVKFNKTVGRASKANFLESRGVARIRANRLGAVDITVPRGLDAVTFVAQLQKSGLFEYAEVNTIGRYEQVTPDDTLFGDLWNLDNTGQTGGTADADVDAPEAWDIAIAQPDVVVGVLDSGVDYDHEDLECNIWVNPGEDLDNDGVVMDADDLNGVDDDGNGFIDDLIGWDFTASDNDPDPTNSHGTHVAGIIGGCGNNAAGIIGVAGGLGADTGARMMPLLVGNNAPNAAILDDAIIYAADQGARVIAMSLSVGASNAIDDALEYAYDTMGVFVVNSSGNDNAAVGYPATNTHVMAVGATDHDDLRAEPDLGLTWGSNFGPELEVVAPGVSIMSTILGDTYFLMSGTSMASPHVSGSAALMFSYKPLATNQQVRDCITATAEDEVGDPSEDTAGRDEFYGFGRLNTADALACMGPNGAPVCDANGPYTAECSMDTLLDGTGSSDPDGNPLTYHWQGPFESSPESGASPTVVFPAPTGSKSVDLTVADPFGGGGNCSATVIVQDTLVPVITSPDDVLAECGSPDGTSVDLGDPVVSDMCDASVNVVNDSPSLFPVGTTHVLWTATDFSGNQSSAVQNVEVRDTIPPTIQCNSPETITPPDAPVSFTSSAEDTCDASPSTMITEYNCYKLNKKGKLINKESSCVVTFGDSTISIMDTGGVDSVIQWAVEATDSHGNQSTKTCEVRVLNPTT